MPTVNAVGQAGVQPDARVAAPRAAAGAPAELQGVRVSRGARIGRVLLGIFTLGISEGIRALVYAVRAAGAQAPRVADPGVPAAPPRADVFNTGIANGLRNKVMPPAFQAAVAEAIKEMSTRFGAEILPKNTTLDTMPESSAIRQALARELEAMGEEVTPQALRALLEARLAQACARRGMEQRIAKYCEEAGLAVSSLATRNILTLSLNLHPELGKALNGCTNLETLTAVLDANASHLKEDVVLKKQLDEGAEQARARVLTSLAQVTGLSEQVLSQKLDMSGLDNTISYFKNDIGQGRNPARGEEIAKEFSRIAERFIKEKTELFTSVDNFELPAQLRESLKNDVLTQGSLSKGDQLAIWYDIANRVKLDGSLLEALKVSGRQVSDTELLGLLETQSLRLFEALEAHYGEKGWIKLGGDGQSDARFYTTQIMINKHPELAEALAAHPGLADRLQTLAHEDLQRATDAEFNQKHPEAAKQLKRAAEGAFAILQAMPSAPGEHNARLADVLGKQDMTPMQAQALEGAVADVRARFGAGSLPEGGLDKVMGAYDPREGSNRLGARMSEALRASTRAVSAEDLGTLFAQTARTTAAYGAFKNLMGELARDFGRDLSEDSINWLASMLRQRHPDLIESLGRAENRADVEAIIDGLPELGALMQMEHDVQAAWTSSVESLVAGMTAATGLPRADVEARLDLSGLTGGRFAYLRQEFRELCGKPETPLEAIPSSQQIRDSYQQVTDAFLAGKRGLYTSIDGLGVSPELAARWKEDVLQNLTLRKADFLQRSVDIARGIRDGGLTKLLAEPGITNETLFDAFVFIGMRKEERAHTIYTADEIKDMGSDELSLLDRTARDAFLDRNPDLVAAMRADAPRMKAVFELGESQLIDLQRQMGRVPLNSPEGIELRARYGALSTACSLISSVVDVE